MLYNGSRAAGDRIRVKLCRNLRVEIEQFWIVKLDLLIKI